MKQKNKPVMTLKTDRKGGLKAQPHMELEKHLDQKVE